MTLECEELIPLNGKTLKKRMAELNKKELIDIGFRIRFSLDSWKSYYGRFLSCTGQEKLDIGCC